MAERHTRGTPGISHDCQTQPDLCRAAEALEQEWVWEGMNFWLEGPSGLLITVWALCDLEDGKPLRVRTHPGKHFEDEQWVDIFLEDNGTFAAQDAFPDSFPPEAIRIVCEWAMLNTDALKDYWARKSDGVDFVRSMRAVDSEDQ